MVKDDIFEKLEFWALTAVFLGSLPALTSTEILPHTVAFGSLMFINFKMVDEIIALKRLWRNILFLVGFFLLFAAAHSIFQPDIYTDGEMASNAFGFASSAILAFIGYVVLKQFALYALSKHKEIGDFFIIFNRDSMIVFGLWLLVDYWILLLRFPGEVRVVWLTAVPTGIILHGIAFYYFIPGSLQSKYPIISYFIRSLVFCIAAGFIVGVCLTLFTDDEDWGFSFGAFDGFVQFIITAPALWLIYRWQMKGNARISELQNELGTSAANLDFLRSQINPHFLFNALNTIYGLAIQENAPRTSESVEKLGEMMRFMLLENMQQRISLAREIEYLDNYISLQKLRIDSNTRANIQVDIQKEISPDITISPMLLIPFVENAFKHGMSFREESYIKVSLELKDSTLYFDVNNSRHEKTGNDPEKDSNGIGLANVKHRLQHMYPRKHELLIRETARDFFVHLQIQLDQHEGNRS